MPTSAPPKLSTETPSLPPELPRPKILRRPLPAGDVPPLVPARMIKKLLYCERSAHLEWFQSEFRDNAFTADGRAVHERADRPKALTPPAGDAVEPVAAGGPTVGDEPYSARAVWLSSERLGLTGKLDVVDVDAEGRVAPVEYKRGKSPDIPEGAYLPSRAQLCAQVLLLREHGYQCSEAFIYFAGDRRRRAIVIDERLIATTLEAVRRLREIAARPDPPPPLDDSEKCDGCSLNPICLPDEVALLRRLAGEAEPAPPGELARSPMEEDLFGTLECDPWGLVGTQADAPRELRRVHPARDDELPLYVQEQGAKIGVSGEELLVRSRHGGAVNARLSNTSQVALFGNVQVSTQAMHTLLRRGTPVSFFSSGGWFIGRLVGPEHKNIDLRRAQFRAAGDEVACLELARGFVVSKILNCRTLLRRNTAEPNAVTLNELKTLSRSAAAAPSLASLLGVEGTAARYYFGAFRAMLKGPDAVSGAFDLDGRNRRPPRDPINALLSFMYALLTRELTVTLSTVGLDPMLGFFHQPRFGRPALALDLMEEFRPLVSDSVVVTAINNGVVTEQDFVRSGGSVALTDSGRKRMISAYERRMDQLVTHPVFGYRISYRRVLEVQARLFSRLLTGEIAVYPAFRTR